MTYTTYTLYSKTLFSFTSVLLPACYNYTLLHSMGQKRETKRGKAPLVFPLLKSPFLNPCQVCAAVRLRRVLAYFLIFTPAAVRLTACPRLLLWRLQLILVIPKIAAIEQIHSNTLYIK